MPANLENSAVATGLENEVWSYYVNGYSSREIAMKLNSSEKSIDNAIFRIRRKLKTLLIAD